MFDVTIPFSAYQYDTKAAIWKRKVDLGRLSLKE